MEMKKALIEPTNACNLKCAGCLVHQMKRPVSYMTKKQFHKALDLCERFNVKEVWLHNWGEPMLHPDITWMVFQAAMRDFTIGITSNGTLLNQYNLKSLWDAGLTFLDISCHQQTPVQLMELYAYARALGLRTCIKVMITYVDDYSIAFRHFEGFKLKFQRQVTLNNKPQIREKPCLLVGQILVINSDGHIVPCCFCYDNQHVMGKLDYPLNDGNFKSFKKVTVKDSILCSQCQEVQCDVPVREKLKGGIEIE